MDLLETIDGSADNIPKDLKLILSNFNIEPNDYSKVFFVSDSATANIKAYEQIQCNMHFSCFNHILNNTIKAAIEKS